MNESPDFRIDSNWIVSQRGRKNEIDYRRPYSWLVEKERSSSGIVDDTGTIFLSNKECSFKCLMCDLWKNTSDESVPPGAIPDQIEWALSKMSSAKHVKLYNSGSFFDERAIPRSDHEKIAELVHDFETVIVESHPNLVGEKCLSFRDSLAGELEVAMGLEIAHPEVLERLNKQMTLDDFKRAADFLNANRVRFRAFILLRPPFLSEQESVHWAKRSIDFAFDCGADCCTIIPVRSGNGAMEKLMEQGDFETPQISSLEEVLTYGISLRKGRVFADLWDLEHFSDCTNCFPSRFERINEMNLSQKLAVQVSCLACGTMSSGWKY